MLKRGSFEVAKAKHFIGKAVSSILTNTFKDDTLERFESTQGLDLVKNHIENLLDKTDGLNPQIKNAVLSATFSKTFIPLDQIHYVCAKNNHVVQIPNIKDKVPIRVLGEIPIAENFALAHKDLIKYIALTGDIYESTHIGKHHDIKMTLESSFGTKETYGDIKSGINMKKQLMEGTIGQLTYMKEAQLNVPNDFCDLVEVNNRRLPALHHLNTHINAEKCLSKEEQQTYNEAWGNIQPLLDTITNDTVVKHIQIEALLMRMRCLPHLPRRPSTITIVQLLTEKELADKEILFINKLAPFITDDIFKNQRTFNTFMKQAFIIYHQTMDKHAVEKLQILRDTSWAPSFLDIMDETVYK